MLHASNDLVVILIAYHGTHCEKYGRRGSLISAKGQFCHVSVRTDDGQWQRVMWPDLEDEMRQFVLNLQRPTWAKAPGKLRSQRARPRKHVTMISEKIVRGSWTH